MAPRVDGVVTVVDGALESAPSAPVAVRTAQPVLPVPAAPAVFLQDGRVVLAWDLDPGVRVDGYRLYRRTEGAAMQLLTPDVSFVKM